MDKKQKITSILAILIIGGVSGHHIDDIIEKYNLERDRYPVIKEFEIMQNCISNYAKPLPYDLYIDKKNICACALGKTELAYDYQSYESDQNKFLDIFEKKANECM